MNAGSNGAATWICCQLGAREHYAVPRALHREGRLRLLVTDAWVRPGALCHAVPARLSRRLCERFHPELADADMRDYTVSLMARESVWRLQRRAGWDLFIDRNRWFQRRAVETVQGVAEHPRKPTVLFAHSYSARDVFRHAKSRGWTTVLGQIDPGEEHQRIVRQVSEQWPEYGGEQVAPPPAYFDEWREECALADWIVVNSEWTRDALERVGIPGRKLRIVPLTYEPDGRDPVPDREYPAAFTPARPLQVLFVGHAVVAKGVAALLESLALLDGVPLELSLVGQVLIAVPPRVRNDPAVRWIGPVSRNEVMQCYREADVLIFPSHSDGFGMAQVEAQGWRLPVIASRFCGRVVRDGVNGILLPEVSPQAIAEALRRVAARPELLAEFSRNADPRKRTGVSGLSSNLLELEPV
jgi:glycosyltransferase involved in cell wall biosynthesis